MAPDNNLVLWPDRYRDRRHAGQVLAHHLTQFAAPHDAVVLALPRGGVPVAFEVAQALDLPLDVFIVRKLGMPGHPEYAMGAIASGGVSVFNEHAFRWFRPTQAQIDEVIRTERAELLRREAAYRGDRREEPLTGRIAVLVDDGLATGASMQAAIKAVRARDPLRVVAAAPVGSPDACWTLLSVADDVVCPLTPERFAAVGSWYDNFAETTDDEVRKLLSLAAQPVKRSA